MTALLRQAWQAGDEADTGGARTHPALYRVQLNAKDVANMEGMTLWDMLSGKYQSRVPGMNGLALDVAPPRWAAWDPCSMNRSRCAFLSSGGVPAWGPCSMHRSRCVLPWHHRCLADSSRTVLW